MNNLATSRIAIAVLALLLSGTSYAQTTLEPPINLMVMQDTDEDNLNTTRLFVTINWDAPDSGETPDSYQIQRKTDTAIATGEFTLLAGADAVTATSFVDQNAQEHGRRYTYRVFSKKGNTLSIASETAETVSPPSSIDPPQIASTQGADTHYTFTWAAIPDEEILDNYLVRIGCGANLMPVNPPHMGREPRHVIPRSTFMVGIVACVTFHASNTGGNSENGSVVPITAPAVNAALPVAPTNLTATRANNGDVSLTWTASASGDPTGYSIQRRLDTDTPSDVFIEIRDEATGGTNVTYTDPAVATANGRQYSYRVLAHNAMGNSPPTDPFTITTAPSAPTGLSISETNSEYTLTWDVVAGEVINGYEVEQAAVAIGAACASYQDVSPAHSGTDTTYTIGALSSGKHCFRVSATNGETSDASGEVTLEVIIPPDAPTALSATLASNGDVSLAWSAPASGETPDNYRIERQVGTGAFTLLPGAGAVSSTVHTDSAADTNGTRHTYRVQGRSNGALGAASDTAAITTIPSVPTGFAFIRRSLTVYELTWGPANEIVTSYAVQQGTACGTLTDIAQPTQPSTRIDTSTLVFGTSYCFSVTATNTGGTSAAGQMTFTPLAADSIDSIVSEGVSKINRITTSRVIGALQGQSSQLLGARIRQITDSQGQAAQLNLNGTDINLDAQSASVNSASGWMMKYAEDLLNGKLDSKQILANSKFSLPFHTRDTSSLVSMFWGRGDYLALSDESDGLEWDGGMLGYTLGVDVQMSHVITGGVAVSEQAGTFDYTNTDDASEGEYVLRLTNAQPYLSWNVGDSHTWLALTSGAGQVHITETDAEKQVSNIKTQGLAVGHSNRIWQNARYTLNAKGNASLTEIAISNDDAAANTIKVDSSTIQASAEVISDTGNAIKPSFEWGVRYTGNDNQDIISMLVDGKIRYTDTNRPHSISLVGGLHGLIGANDYQEWGISGVFNIAPGRDLQGFSLNLAPSITTGANTDMDEWQRLSNPSTPDADPTPEAVLDLAVGYGISLPSLHGRLTPYSETHIATNQNRHRLGTKWNTIRLINTGVGIQLNLFTEQTITDTTNTSIMLKGELQF